MSTRGSLKLFCFFFEGVLSSSFNRFGAHLHRILVTRKWHTRTRASLLQIQPRVSLKEEGRRKKKKKKGRTSHWPPLSVQPEQLQLAPGQPEHWHLPLGQQCASSGQQHASGCGQQPSPCVVSQHVWCELRIRRNDFF
jgi:hypothetical protein